MHGPGGRGRAHREEDGGLLRGDAPAVHPGPPAAGGTRRVVANLWQISTKFRSFSAVSAPIFATKYAFCSIFQNLPDSLVEIFEI